MKRILWTLCLPLLALAATRSELSVQLRESVYRNYWFARDTAVAPNPAQPRVGIYPENVGPGELEKLTGKREVGIRVWHLLAGSPADLMGVGVGDIITGLDGAGFGQDSARAGDVFSQMVRQHAIGDTVRLTLLRAGKPVELRVPLESGMPALSMKERLHPEFARPKEISRLAEFACQFGIADSVQRVAADVARIARTSFETRPVLKERHNLFRLEEVTHCLAQPMDLPLVSDQLAASLAASFDSTRTDLGGLVSTAASYIDVNAPTIAPSPRVASLEGLLALLRHVETLRRQAFRLLDSTEIAFALEKLPVQWSFEYEETDTLDKVKDRDLRRQMIAASEDTLVRLFLSAYKVDYERLFLGAAALTEVTGSDFLVAIKRYFERQPESVPEKYRDRFMGDVRLVRETPYGLLVVGGPGKTVYAGDAAFIFDLGGDDVYANNAGGSRPDAPVSFVVDYAGDDVYETSDDFAQGSGFLGIGLLCDLAGNDVYHAGRHSQASGLLGVGMLWDKAGDDCYQATSFTQGAAFFGLGLLCEGEGQDEYRANAIAQGFGAPKGLGAIVEAGGSDVYVAGGKYPDYRKPERAYDSMAQGFGWGLRPWTLGVGLDGGIGVICEQAGNDVYLGDYFCQGSSYWYALGVLADFQGSDRYLAGCYSQGAGIHLSCGALLDYAGDDQYTCYVALCQGAAHDWAVGVLHDLSGDDLYVGEGAVQGGCGTVSLAVLCDDSGKDTYVCKDTTNSQGAGVWSEPRQYGSLGVLIDGGEGADRFTDTRIVPGEPLRKARWGVAWKERVSE